MSTVQSSLDRVAVLLALLLFAQVPATTQTQQSPSPMVDHTRPHPRITQTETPGRRVDLKSVKGAKRFSRSRVQPTDRVALLIDFDGASWLVEEHVARHAAPVALIT